MMDMKGKLKHEVKAVQNQKTRPTINMNISITELYFNVRIVEPVVIKGYRGHQPTIVICDSVTIEMRLNMEVPLMTATAIARKCIQILRF